MRWLGVASCASAVLAAAQPVCAEDRPAAAPWREMWAGAEASADFWSIYAGQTYALSGAIMEDGWRLRAVSGYGRYRYRSSHWDGSENVAATHRGMVAFADILLGYHWHAGPLTVKVFAGATGDSHTVSPFDPQNEAQGFALGARLVLESWLNLGEAAWLSLDAGWESAHETSTSRARLGYRALPWLSVGVEGAHVDTPNLLTLRGGAFVRAEWAAGEASLSGGLADDDGPGRASAYGTLNVLWRF